MELHKVISPLQLSYRILGLSIAFLLLIACASCSSKKFLSPGQFVLSDVHIKCNQKHIKTTNYRSCVRQEPSTKWFSLVKVTLGIYCLSPADTTKRKGRIWRRIGEPPVIYDEKLTNHSVQSIKQALFNDGYLHAQVDTIIQRKSHKIDLTYQITPGPLYRITQLSRVADSPKIQEILDGDSLVSLLYVGMPLSMERLAAERTRMIHSLHNKGYYYINNNFISYDLDTIANETNVVVTQRFSMPEGCDSTVVYCPQHLRKIYIVENIIGKEHSTDEISTLRSVSSSVVEDSLSKNTLNAIQPVLNNFASKNGTVTFEYRGLTFSEYDDYQLSKHAYFSHVSLEQNHLYSEKKLQRTFRNLNALSATSMTSIRFNPSLSTQVLPTDTISTNPSSVRQVYRTDSLDCVINMNILKKRSIGLEVEGTNTAGNLGAGLVLAYTNRNLFGSSELLTLKTRFAFEAIRGLEGYSKGNFTEWGAEANLRVPDLLFPFVSRSKKRDLNVSTDFRLMVDRQDRPEFHRRVLTASWIYDWNSLKRENLRHKVNLFSINYVYMPWISDTFRQTYLEGDNPHYAVIRHSYEDLFIIKSSYQFNYQHGGKAFGYVSLETDKKVGDYELQIKGGVELAGNMLYGISQILKNEEEKPRKLFDIAYSQYAKADFDVAKSFTITPKNSLAFHASFGIAIPYGNSSIIPYDVRYFSGGANSVRGWNVRELGPGAYQGENGKVDFINQSGNLKLDMSVEWRTWLLGKLHTAIFVDAGNIWNTRNYEGLEEGVFHFDSFYRQIAVAYGLGLRLNFNYFILRLDGGMKAINPAGRGRNHFPIIRPIFSRDFAWHFSVGLPF